MFDESMTMAARPGADLSYRSGLRVATFDACTITTGAQLAGTSLIQPLPPLILVCGRSRTHTRCLQPAPIWLERPILGRRRPPARALCKN